MGLFFDITNEADKKLMQEYDAAVGIFRIEVSKAMEDAAMKEPSLAIPLRAAAEALRQRPLPSEANSDPEALRRLTLSSLTVEMAFSKLKIHAATEEAFAEAMSVVVRMREIGGTTISRAEFKPMTQAAIVAVSGMKEQVAKEMDALVFDLHVGELKKAKRPGASAKNTPPLC